MDPIVTTTAGRVRGFVDDGALSFLGVPFAAPPFGPNRLLAPAPPEPWDGARDALAYGPTSQQPDDEILGGIPEPSIAGEDILTVNVFTPSTAPLQSAGLPVLVWIHGGGFFAGSPASPWYRGTRFARDGIVVVTLGYRLGAEGFLELEGAPSNRAVLDWLAALRWVQDNIEAFGGNPDLVTIAGQSAGAVACTTLLGMPEARGLFRRVISMSGVAMAVTPEQAAETARALTDPMGIEPTRDAVAALPFADFHAAQRALQHADDRASGGIGMTAPSRFSPLIDGDLVPAKPLKAIAQGIGGDIDVLAGTTRDEANFGVRRRQPNLDETQLLQTLERLGLPAEAYRQHHHSVRPAEVLGRAVTDRMFRSRLQSLLETRALGADAGAGRTFAYEFRWHPTREDMRANIGAAHCIDIPFAFDNLDAHEVAGLAGPHPPQTLADLMHAAWVSFVVSGDPGWPAHDLDKRQMMLFDVESGPADDPLRAERALWER
jgi:para-nitrobenzyl esterase